MANVYSTYEARSKFSEIIRKVMAGQRVIIAYRGHEVAEIRPLEQQSLPCLEKRLERLEYEGILGPPAEPEGHLPTLAKRPGALARFLESRE